SFSNAPDEATLGRVAGALAVDEAFAEKDWFVVQAIKRLTEFSSDGSSAAWLSLARGRFQPLTPRLQPLIVYAPNSSSRWQFSALPPSPI
ncbi:MAG: hypothetical protein LOX97_01485, partial [Sphingomonas sp.]|nr:hypothetical protein [Sphingomonas sp.]